MSLATVTDPWRASATELAEAIRGRVVSSRMVANGGPRHRHDARTERRTDDTVDR
jgi:hypothetical protein